MFLLKISRPDPARYHRHTFQHPAGAARLSIRPVDLAQRVAFGARVPPGASSAALQRLLATMDRVGGSRGTSARAVARGVGGGGGKDNPCRISPSPNHAALLEFLHGRGGRPGAGTGDGARVVRQLQWNAACSPDADPWFEAMCDDGDSRAAPGNMTGSSLDISGKNNGESALDKARQRQLTQRRRVKDIRGRGRYAPLDPVAATKAMLPSHSPILTNVKRRLPNRSDVGFAGPSPEDVSRKMEEVKREAEWEEASPRIVLLVSGSAVLREEREEGGPGALHPSCRADARLWAGGSIPGVPFAGRDLVTALRAGAGASDASPRAYSVFAPPVDATPSPTHGWRPRPFTDRPPGRVYLVACPLDLRCGDGDGVPCFCTLGLYCLPMPQRAALTGGGERDGTADGGSGGAQKISEVRWRGRGLTRRPFRWTVRGCVHSVLSFQSGLVWLQMNARAKSWLPTTNQAMAGRSIVNQQTINVLLGVLFVF